MTPELSSITGRENKKSFSTPVAALIEFYDAFNNRDLENLSRNWVQTDYISIHRKRL